MRAHDMGEHASCLQANEHSYKGMAYWCAPSRCAAADMGTEHAFSSHDKEPWERVRRVTAPSMTHRTVHACGLHACVHRMACGASQRCTFKRGWSSIPRRRLVHAMQLQQLG